KAATTRCRLLRPCRSTRPRDGPAIGAALEVVREDVGCGGAARALTDDAGGEGEYHGLGAGTAIVARRDAPKVLRGLIQRRADLPRGAGDRRSGDDVGETDIGSDLHRVVERTGHSRPAQGRNDLGAGGVV